VFTTERTVVTVFTTERTVVTVFTTERTVVTVFTTELFFAAAFMRHHCRECLCAMVTHEMSLLLSLLTLQQQKKESAYSHCRECLCECENVRFENV